MDLIFMSSGGRRSRWNVEQLVTVDQNKRGQTESASQKPEIISTTYKAL